MRKSDILIAKLKHFFFYYKKLLLAISIVAIVPLIYWLVYATGGIKFVFSHTMYIPIILAGMFVHPIFGAFVGIFGGLMLGPIMPYDTFASTLEPQEPINWIYRMIIFTAIGVVTGIASKRITDLQMRNQDTGLPNTNYLNKGINLLSTGRQSIITILLNNYQDILDILGVDTYHSLIQLIERRIKGEFGRDCLIIQVDNNRFWIIKPMISSLRSDIDTVLMVLKTLTSVDGNQVYAEFSLGAHEAEKRDECQKMATFIYSDNAARMAMEAHLPFVIYQDERFQKRKQYELLMHMRESFDDEQFFLVFQPQIDLSDRRIIALEALVRWQHKTKGIIMPGDFIPLMEQTRMISELTDYVFRHTIDAQKSLTRLGYRIPISVNVSARNLYDTLFFERVYRQINEASLDPALIQIEVTESTVMENPEQSAEVLKQFADHGIKVLVDDFGTGYSSLSYLSRYPVDTIKIDRYFIKNIEKNPSVAKIVVATVKLAHDLGYQVLAEGVETELVLNSLIDGQFDEAQGFLFSRPIPLDDIIKLFEINAIKREDKYLDVFIPH